MRLTVFGGTGGTGRLLVRQALDAGHEVVAAGRRPPTIDHPALRIVGTDVADPRSVEQAMTGSDAVLSALGPRGRKDPARVCSAAIAAIVEAMAATGVRRVVAISAQPVLDSGAGEPLWYRATVRPLVRAVYRDVYADLERMERILTASSADWTVLRPPYLTDGPATGRYRRAVDANVAGIGMTRADLACAMLDVLADPATVGHAVGVAGPAKDRRSAVQTAGRAGINRSQGEDRPRLE